MKLHSHYCQDPNCPSRWDDDGCANVPREERRPKVGDRVRSPFVNDPVVYFVDWTGEHMFTARNRAGELMLSACLTDRGVTWDFSDEEPVKQPCRTCFSTDWTMRAGLQCNRCPVAPASQTVPTLAPSDGMTIKVDPALPDDTIEMRDESGKPIARAVNVGDGMTEREREAWEIHNAGTVAGYDFRAYDWGDMEKFRRRECLGARDKAEAPFAAKADERVKRALDETSAACDAIERLRKERDNARRVRDEWKTSHYRMEGLLAEAQSERDEARRARDVYKASQDSAMQCWGQCAKERDEARDEVMQLKGWKESAMQVFAEWDKVGQEALQGMNPRLGSSIPEESAKAIRAMREENTRLTAQNAELVAALRYCAHGSALEPEEDLVIARQLLARIDAEAAGKQTAAVGEATTADPVDGHHGDSTLVNRYARIIADVVDVMPAGELRGNESLATCVSKALAAAEVKGRRVT